MPTVPKQDEKPTDEWMSLQAAADVLGKSRSSVLTLILKGELVAQHIANRTVVRRDSLDALVAARAAAIPA
jgi:hypothetical protein